MRTSNYLKTNPNQSSTKASQILLVGEAALLHSHKTQVKKVANKSIDTIKFFIDIQLIATAIT